MSLTTAQLEELTGLAQQGKMGSLNDLADRWGVKYLEVARSYADVRRTFDSPSSAPAPSMSAAPAPAAEPAPEREQEVQHKMPRGTPTQNHPGDVELIRMAEELKAQGAPNLGKALAEKLGVKVGTARTWHYKARLHEQNKSTTATPTFVCEACWDSGHVGGGDAGVACNCDTGRRLSDQMQEALAETAAGPVLGNVPLKDATAPVVPAEDRKTIHRFPSDCTVTGTTASADSFIKLVDGETGPVPATTEHALLVDKVKTHIAKLGEQAREREALLQIANADRAMLTEHVAQLKNALHDVDMASANVASLMAENERLQADLKAAAATIEQAAQGCVIYQLIDNDPPGRPEVLTMAPGDVLLQGDEWAQVYTDEGRRRLEIWHCVDTIALSGGNVVCTLRPGFAETTEEVA